MLSALDIGARSPVSWGVWSVNCFISLYRAGAWARSPVVATGSSHRMLRPARPKISCIVVISPGSAMNAPSHSLLWLT